MGTPSPRIVTLPTYSVRETLTRRWNGPHFAKGRAENVPGRGRELAVGRDPGLDQVPDRCGPRCRPRERSRGTDPVHHRDHPGIRFRPLRCVPGKEGVGNHRSTGLHEPEDHLRCADPYCVEGREHQNPVPSIAQDECASLESCPRHASLVHDVVVDLLLQKPTAACGKRVVEQIDILRRMRLVHGAAGRGEVRPEGEYG